MVFMVKPTITWALQGGDDTILTSGGEGVSPPARKLLVLATAIISSFVKQHNGNRTVVKKLMKMCEKCVIIS